MGIVAKHAYRFVYLKSDKWKDVRFEALARERSKCQICEEEDFSNDAHHIWYPESIWKTDSEDLVILCRPCHEMVQELFFQQASRELGRQSFKMLTRIIHTWIAKKRSYINGKIVQPSKIITSKSVEYKKGYCHKCLNQGETRGVDIFKLLKSPLPYNCVKVLCPVCMELAKTEIIVDYPKEEIAEGRAKGFAFRNIRRWFDKPL